MLVKCIPTIISKTRKEGTPLFDIFLVFSLVAGYQCAASDYRIMWSAIFSNFGLDGWYRLYSICEKSRTLRFALCITMCFCSQQYKLTDSLFSCANICYAHFEDALKRGFKKAFLYEINALFFLNRGCLISK